MQYRCYSAPQRWLGNTTLLLLLCGIGACEKPATPAPTATAPPPPSSAVEQAAQTLQGGGGTYRVVDVPNPGALSVFAGYTGELPPAPTKVPVNINMSTCGDKVFTENLLVDHGGRGIQNVVVRLDGITAGKALPGDMTITNKDCAFSPHVGVGIQGMKLQLKNEDPILHTTRPIIDQRALFNKPLVPNAPPPNPRTIRQAGLMEVKCDVHDWMQAWVVVHTNPYVAVSDASGKLVIDAIPPGTYPFVAWHEQLGEQRGQVEILADQTSELKLEFSSKEG